MNRNIFIKNKTNENKFNPDVIKKYSDANQNRSSTRFEFLNKPYKVIIKDKVPQNIESQDDLRIDMSENNVDINNNFSKLVNDRKYLDDANKKKFNDKEFKNNKSKFDFRNYQISKVSHDSNDFNELKSEKVSYYEKQKSSILQEKSKYNDIMNNLKKQGII